VDIKGKLLSIIKKDNLHKGAMIVISREDYIQLIIELGIAIKLDELTIYSHNSIKPGSVQIADEHEVRIISL